MRRTSRVHWASAALACAAALLASSARASDGANPDEAQSNDDAARHRIDRTWLYADDARVVAPMTVVGTSSVSYTSVGSSPSRLASPFPTVSGGVYNGFAGNTAQPGAMLSVGGEVGLVAPLSILATGQLGLGGVDSVPSPSAGAVAGVRLRLSPSGWERTHVALSGGYLREAWSGPVYDDDAGKWLPGSPRGDNGAWVQAAFSTDFERVRLAATLHGEHIFSVGRDPLDVMAELGASYRVVEGLRLGVEYVGQDLEETFTPGAEAGARHFLGPVASLQLLDQRMTIVGGPAVGLSAFSPAFVGRIGVSYGF
jgi:hypothetical protein